MRRFREALLNRFAGIRCGIRGRHKDFHPDAAKVSTSAHRSVALEVA
jgi:hypothetical protein